MKTLHLLITMTLLLLTLTGCRTPGSTGHLYGLADDQATEPGGYLDVHVIPPSTPLDWTTPNTLARTTVVSKGRGEFEKLMGWTEIPHPIGHLHISMDCDDVKIPLTGQTGSGSEYASALDGLGASFRTYQGYLDDTATVLPDVEARQQSGLIATMRFAISKQMCRHLAGFLEEYQRRGAEQKYGGQFRPRRFEGAGCSAFGVAFIELGAFIKRSVFTPKWARSVQVGLGRLADVGGDGTYEYGSNFQYRTSDDELVEWPASQPVRVQRAPIRPGSPWLSQWSDDRDAATNPAEGQPDTLPWTIYDPELIFNNIQAIAAAGGGEHLGRDWQVSYIGRSVLIETNAVDALPQPYYDDQDDLFKD